MSAQLELRGLRRGYVTGEPAAVADLDLLVPASSCVAVVGPSGSGKSTVLRLACGLERPDAGDVLLDGRSVLGVPTEQRGMALLSQRPLLFPHLSVLDNVAFPARVAGTGRRAARAGAERYLELVRLAGYGHRFPGELSGGQEQRVALARALAAEPRVLLLDEPFSALDTVLRAEMHELLAELRAALEPTVVLVTHDHAEAAAVADSLAVLADGRLLQHGPVEEVFTRPASLAVARLTGGRNEVPGVVRDEVHHSALGALELPAGAALADGPAVLVVRHESVQVTGHDGPMDDPVDDRAATVTGTVRQVRPAGLRRLVAVAAGREGAALLWAETEPGRPVAVGDRVGLRLPRRALAVVPAGDAAPVSGTRAGVSPARSAAEVS